MNGPNKTPEGRKASVEHLYYEVEMFFWAAERLKGQTKPRETPRCVPSSEGLLRYRSLVEVYAIHFRALVDFLWVDGRKDNVRARDYVRDWEAWTQERPPDIKSEHKKATKWAAHLSYDRSGVSDWRWKDAALCELRHRLIEFLETAPPDIDSECIDAMKRIAEAPFLECGPRGPQGAYETEGVVGSTGSSPDQ